MSKDVYNMDDMGVFGLKAFRLAKRITEDVAYFLPRNTAVEEVRICAVGFSRMSLTRSLTLYCHGFGADVNA